ncbi:MAG: VOC family protein [Planctomycetota bacterium]
MPILRHHYVLAVPDLERSAAWYAAALGCERDDVDPGNWVFMRSGDVTFMLGRCPDALPIADLGDHQYFAYLVVDDVDAWHRRAEEAGAKIQFPPRDQLWGMRECAIHTVDGHRLMIAQELD